MTPNQHALFERRYRTIVFWALAAVLVVLAGMLVAPFVGAILWAGVLTVLFYPLYLRFRQKVSENVAAVGTVLATLGLIIVPMGLIGLMLYLQVGGYVQKIEAAAPAAESQNAIQNIIENIDETTKPVLDRLGADFKLSEWFENNRAEIVRRVTGPVGHAVFGTAYMVFTLVIALLTMFFMLRDGHRLRDPVLDLMPLPREKTLYILERVRDTIFAVFVGVVLVALIQGTIAGILYWATGVPSPLLWAVATTILCAVPLVGAPIVYVPMAILLATQAKWTEAVILAAGGFLIVSQIDNLLRPFFIGARVKLHPMGVFFSLLGGVLTMGPIGIMSGPVLLSVMLAIIDIVRESRQQASLEVVAGDAT